MKADGFCKYFQFKRMYKITALLITACCIIISCRKKPEKQISHDKGITSFQITSNDPVSYKGIIRNDSIFVKLRHGARLDSLTALIEYKGKSIEWYT